MIFVVAVIVGLAFGAADQYLGTTHSTLTLGWWTLSVSQMAALWVLFPFAFGWTQDDPRRATLSGLVATVAALAGYAAMTVSPMEGVALQAAPAGGWAWVRGNVPVVAAGLVTGPLFGYLGHRWRVDAWWVGPAVLSAVFLMEPILRRRGQPPPRPPMGVGRRVRRRRRPGTRLLGDAPRPPSEPLARLTAHAGPRLNRPRTY